MTEVKEKDYFTLDDGKKSNAVALGKRSAPEKKVIFWKLLNNKVATVVKEAVENVKVKEDQEIKESDYSDEDDDEESVSKSCSDEDTKTEEKHVFGKLKKRQRVYQ